MNRVECLRSWELDCYRLCYEILQSELLAAEAAKEALICLYTEPAFFGTVGPEQFRVMKREAIRASMEQLAYSPHWRQTVS